MKTIVQTAIVALFIFAATGCNNRKEELERQNAELQRTNSQLNQDLTARDQYINTVTDSINAVYLSMETLKADEASLLKEKHDLESTKKLTPNEIFARLGEKINAIRVTLSDNHNRINELQKKLASSKRQIAGLNQLVDNLNKTLAERDQTIADLGVRVMGLEKDVSEKGRALAEKNALITQKDSVISIQHSEITTAYYIAGTRDELEKAGIIVKEGGFPWGLFGSTMILASGFDTKNFKPIDKTTSNTIRIEAKINEIIPKRNPEFYKQAIIESGQSTLTISNPEKFWKDKYLVIVTDRPSPNVNLTE